MAKTHKLKDEDIKVINGIIKAMRSSPTWTKIHKKVVDAGFDIGPKTLQFYPQVKAVYDAEKEKWRAIKAERVKTNKRRIPKVKRDLAELTEREEALYEKMEEFLIIARNYGHVDKYTRIDRPNLKPLED